MENVTMNLGKNIYSLNVLQYQSIVEVIFFKTCRITTFPWFLF